MNLLVFRAFGPDSKSGAGKPVEGSNPLSSAWETVETLEKIAFSLCFSGFASWSCRFVPVATVPDFVPLLGLRVPDFVPLFSRAFSKS